MVSDERTPEPSERQHYIDSTREKVARVMLTIEKVRARLKTRQAQGNAPLDVQLEKSELQMDFLFAAVQTNLSAVADATDENWLRDRDSVENAWEDLNRSINQIVSRVS